jgi:hypothetical protein
VCVLYVENAQVAGIQQEGSGGWREYNRGVGGLRALPPAPRPTPRASAKAAHRLGLPEHRRSTTDGAANCEEHNAARCVLGSDQVAAAGVLVLTLRITQYTGDRG